jgi:hypothetical protein
MLVELFCTSRLSVIRTNALGLIQLINVKQEPPITKVLCQEPTDLKVGIEILCQQV